VSPFSPCYTLKGVQVLLDPMMVGSRTWIEPLRSILLFSALFLSKFRSDGPRSVGNFGWDPTISSSSQTFESSITRSMLCCLRSFDLPELIFYLPIDYKLVVLMPSSLLYFPSMTSIRCLLNIFHSLSVKYLNICQQRR
jgi:hypothetical protein